MKLSKAQLELMASLADRPQQLATTRDRAQLSRMGLIEAHRNPLRPSYRRPPWRLTEAGRAALKDTTHAE